MIMVPVKTLDQQIDLLSTHGLNAYKCNGRQTQPTLVKRTLGDDITNFFHKNTFIDNDTFLTLLAKIKKQAIESQDPTDPIHQKIRTIFTQKLAELNSQTFITSMVGHGIFDEAFQNYLSSDLKTARQNQEAGPVEGRANADDLDLEVRIQEVSLAIMLGVGMEKNKGTTGSLIVCDLTGKPRGVYKLNSNHHTWLMRFIRFFKKTFWGQLKYLSNQNPDSQSKAEVAAYKASVHFNFNLTPASKMTTINGQQGAFMGFIEGYEEASKGSKGEKSYIESLEERASKGLLEPEEIDAFQKMAVFDYLIGNLDRHEENWFVKTEDGRLSDIKAIDNANSFLKINPGSTTKVGNQYKWKNLRIAEQQLTENTKAFIRRELTVDKIRSFVASIGLTSELNFLDKDMKDLLIKRLSVLRAAANMKNTPTTCDLGMLITDQAIDDFITPVIPPRAFKTLWNTEEDYKTALVKFKAKMQTKV